jgi:hypothetical protein
LSEKWGFSTPSFNSLMRAPNWVSSKYNGLIVVTQS